MSGPEFQTPALFFTILDMQTAIIAYRPFSDEPDPEILCRDADILLFIPQSNFANPYICAEICTAVCKQFVTTLLVPGSAFDLSGGRYGRGKGWFDRFLTVAPKEWRRIGVAFENQISKTPLVRESWDMSVDALAIFDTVSQKYLFLDATKAPSLPL